MDSFNKKMHAKNNPQAISLKNNLTRQSQCSSPISILLNPQSRPRVVPHASPFAFLILIRHFPALPFKIIHNPNAINPEERQHKRTNRTIIKKKAEILSRLHTGQFGQPYQHTCCHYWGHDVLLYWSQILQSQGEDYRGQESQERG